MTRVEYYELPALSHIYLEDSYVLDIIESDSELRFLLDIVLTEFHPDYHPPVSGEQYCYRKGELIFEETCAIQWLRKTRQVFRDANGEIDYGNIDVFYYEDGRYHIEGDWGSVMLSSESLQLQIM
jgi:hypothetical protein